MLSDEVIEKLVERLVNRVEQANTYFLMELGKKVKQIKNITPNQAQQLEQILKYGGDYEDIIKQIAKYTGLNIKDIDAIFENYAKQDQQFYKQFYKYRNRPFIPYKENEVLQRQTQALANIVKNEMYNFTRDNVLGYTIRDVNGRVQFYGLRETYNRVLDEALLNVGQGKETFDSAMTRIMKDIGGSGLKTIEYQSGRSMRLDSAVRMHLKGRLRELHNENQKIFGEEFDSDGVEISVHANPAPDHLMQGHQFSNEEFAKLQNGQQAVDYKGQQFTLDHDDKNGYRPISELNCYHYIFSIILGVSEPEYSDKELQQIIDDNNKGFEFENKHYTNYEGTQLQRTLERRIREQKDVQTLAKASGNNELVAESQQKITQLTQKYKELSDVSGFPTKMQRLRVSGYRKVSVETTQNENKNKFSNINDNKKYQDLTDQLKNMVGKENAETRKLDYALTLDGEKLTDFYFEPDVKMEDEINYQLLIERKTGYKTFLNPKAKRPKTRTADFWVEDIDELWDLKRIDGNKPKTIDTIFKDAKGQTENLILKPRKTEFTINEIKEKINVIYDNAYRKHIKQVVLVDKNDNIILYYKR